LCARFGSGPDRTPVDDSDYQVPFRFTGKLAKVTIKLGPVIHHALAKVAIADKGSGTSSMTNAERMRKGVDLIEHLPG
jgi:hypothetical protein